MISSDLFDIITDLLESMNDSIVVDKNGKIIFFSESYARDANVQSKDVIGKKVTDIIMNTRLHKILETGEEEIAEGIAANLKIDGVSSTVSSTPYHICNRIPIKRNGAPRGEILGAFAYTSLANEKQLRKLTEQLQAMRAYDKMLTQHLSEAYQPKYLIDSIVGNSSAITNLKKAIFKAAPSDVTVLITGETGTGKELIAGAVHGLSPRKNNAFIKINCASIPENLLESELFGYEPGSFTGALKSGKIGKFELADGGTILLDEIGEMPLQLQAKLLRVLQEREIERIGGKTPIPVDVRVICSTNRNLQQQVTQGLFREDLFYRINVVELVAPSLRDRFDDIPMLCETFIHKNNNRSYNTITNIAPEVLNFFKTYTWPGNVRELEHAVECACIMNQSTTLTVSSFDFLKQRIVYNKNIADSVDNSKSSELNFSEGSYSIGVETPDNYYMNEKATTLSRPALTLTEASEITEYNMISEAMEKCHYKISDVADYLGVNRTSLYRKLKKYGIFPYDK